MRILLVGSGGREHALAIALAASPSCTALLAAPGNPGIGACAELHDVPADDVAGLVRLAAAARIDLVVAGPETALALGLADALADAGIACFGPSRNAARLESSKAFTKAFCARHAIPTADWAAFDACEPALARIAATPGPWVVKADGLAAGKGVTIADTREAAAAAVQEIFAGRFGDGGASVVIEDFMEGEEVSLFALCDGERAAFFGAAQDHKRAFDGDVGPNTGGMGAFSPVSLADPALVRAVMDGFIQPTLAGMAAEGHPFRGVLYAGLMLTPGGPRLVEYNARFGDPEAQVLLARFEGDLGLLLHACASGNLSAAPAWSLSTDHAAVVVLAAEGYPDTPARRRGASKGWSWRPTCPAAHLCRAGTRIGPDCALQAAGGRVLNALGRGPTLRAALDAAYAVADRVVWADKMLRRDIGWRELARDAEGR